MQIRLDNRLKQCLMAQGGKLTSVGLVPKMPFPSSLQAAPSDLGAPEGHLDDPYQVIYHTADVSKCKPRVKTPAVKGVEEDMIPYLALGIPLLTPSKQSIGRGSALNT